MIYPSVYSFNAPYRGPKDSNEINKLFTSIIYDLSIVDTATKLSADILFNNIKFCIDRSVNAIIEHPSAGHINGESYGYLGINEMSRELNAVESKVDQIFENI